MTAAKSTRRKYDPKEFLVCADNTGYKASLQIGKSYGVIQDEEAPPEGFIRVIDESGEDYLYPIRFFDQHA